MHSIQRNALASLGVLTALAACSASPATSDQDIGRVSSADTSGVNSPPPGWPAPTDGPWQSDPTRKEYNVSAYCNGYFEYADNFGYAYCGANYDWAYCHHAGDTGISLPLYTPSDAEYCVCCPDWLTETSVGQLGYQLMALEYAPPGDASSVSYSSGSLTGSQSQIQTVSQEGIAITVTSSAVSSSASWTTGAVHQNTIQDTLQSNTGFGMVNSAATGDAINHGNDLFTIWTTPLLTTTTNFSTGAQTMAISDSPNSHIVQVYLSDLENPSQMSAGIAALLSGLTSDDFAQIASADPWHANRNFDPRTEPDRFTLQSQNAYIVLESPSTSSEPTPVQTLQIQSSSQDTLLSGTQSNTQIQVLAGLKVSWIAEGGVQVGVQYSYQYQRLNGAMTGTQYGAQAILASSTLCYTQIVAGWLDNMFNTYAFTGDAPTTACGDQASVYQQVSSGTPAVAGVVTSTGGNSVMANWEVDATFATTPPQTFRGFTHGDGTFAFVNGIPDAPVSVNSPGGVVRMTAIPGLACAPDACGTKTNQAGTVSCGACPVTGGGGVTCKACVATGGVCGSVGGKTTCVHE